MKEREKNERKRQRHDMSSQISGTYSKSPEKEREIHCVCVRARETGDMICLHRCHINIYIQKDRQRAKERERERGREGKREKE